MRMTLIWKCLKVMKTEEKFITSSCLLRIVYIRKLEIATKIISYAFLKAPYNQISTVN
jgi:hypothetical protein